MTTEPTERMNVAVDVPHHTKLMKHVVNLMDRAEDNSKKMDEFISNFLRIVKDTINSAAREAGQVTVPMELDLLTQEGAKIRIILTK